MRKGEKHEQLFIFMKKHNLFSSFKATRRCKRYLEVLGQNKTTLWN